MTGKDILPEKNLLEKAATIKRFEYLLLGKELKEQTDTAKKQYQKLDYNYEFDNIIKKEKPIHENYSKSNLIYNSNYSFYRDSKKLDNLSLESKHLLLAGFFDYLNKFNKLNPRKKHKRGKNVYAKASDLYNDFIAIYFDEYNELDARRKKWSSDMILKSYLLKYIIMMCALKMKNQLIQQEQVITPNKLLTRLSVLLAQIKARKNSYKLNNKITKKVYNNLIKSL